jgi:GDP/UDP-N,N'-diacetylbacillosamine 2-epimerase (hydrolysing)
MEGTLRAIQGRRELELQLVVTGMHLDRRHGRTVDEIRRDGWRVDAVVPWRPAGDDLTKLAEQTGAAGARLARAFDRLGSDIVLAVGDRVEAFAAASAGHLCGRLVAHVHGGDRALGQVDDALRHAITKLAHVHFAATSESADRILRLGEDRRRVHLVGSPGLDGLREQALSWSAHQPITLAGKRLRYALVVLHPTSADEAAEHRRAAMILAACRRFDFEEIHVVWPNNDPGARGIVRCWKEHPHAIAMWHENLMRPAFLGLLRDAAVLVGNSSSGIIEAASFGTPVIDVGDRQKGRLAGENVTNVPFNERALRSALRKVWNDRRPVRFAGKNPYARPGTGRRIARVLATMALDQAVRRKLIAY